ncbi:hypothetical protein AVEN_48039-1 [Araneus ventricosus]|uniref:Uncharacterized protein n=1 Tax=Araneus ventricosus TaxID=182803 RepID=A0A4Y2E9Y5_ARAVE|nr:hypothetical protein AVEN_248909-1 [Araneus ventricosus]GBM25960.1 hypothetical protein AVEN_48039-1 [Araneus ventricosus]
MANIICCTTTEAHTSLKWVGLCFSLSPSDGNGEDTPVNTLTNSAGAGLHLFSILHGRIKFYLPPYGPRKWAVVGQKNWTPYSAYLLSDLRTSLLLKRSQPPQTDLRLC